MDPTPGLLSSGGMVSSSRVSDQGVTRAYQQDYFTRRLLERVTLRVLFVVPIKVAGGGDDDGTLDMSGVVNENVLPDETVDVGRFEELYEREYSWFWVCGLGRVLRDVSGDLWI